MVRLPRRQFLRLAAVPPPFRCSGADRKGTSLSVAPDHVDRADGLRVGRPDMIARIVAERMRGVARSASHR